MKLVQRRPKALLHITGKEFLHIVAVYLPTTHKGFLHVQIHIIAKVLIIKDSIVEAPKMTADIIEALAIKGNPAKVLADIA